jgi:hypothetical protein
MWMLKLRHRPGSQQGRLLASTRREKYAQHVRKRSTSQRVATSRIQWRLTLLNQLWQAVQGRQIADPRRRSQRRLHQRQASSVEGIKAIASIIPENKGTKPVFQSQVVIQGNPAHKAVPTDARINAKTAKEKPAAAGLGTAGTGRTLMTSPGGVHRKGLELVKENGRVRKDTKTTLKGPETKREWPCSRHSPQLQPISSQSRQ